MTQLGMGTCKWDNSDYASNGNVPNFAPDLAQDWFGHGVVRRSGERTLSHKTLLAATCVRCADGRILHPRARVHGTVVVRHLGARAPIEHVQLR